MHVGSIATPLKVTGVAKSEKQVFFQPIMTNYVCFRCGNECITKTANKLEKDAARVASVSRHTSHDGPAHDQHCWG